MLLSPSSTKEEIESEFEENEYLVYLDKQDDIRKALDEGKTVYLGNVSYEECEYHLDDLYEKIWKIVKDNSDGDFIAFDDDLSY